jgi:alpha/beta superfamily hydrolase
MSDGPTAEGRPGARVGPVVAVDLSTAEDPWLGAVLLHPHPAYGGDRFNIVVDALYRALPPAGVTAARFDFTSAAPDVAAAEAVAALDRVDARPLVLVGYSFGADVAATVTDGRLGGWFLVAPPLRLVGRDRMAVADDPRPKGLAIAELDQFSPPETVRAAVAGWRSTSVSVVPGADHFLFGSCDEVVRQALRWLRSIPGAPPAARGPGTS